MTTTTVSVNLEDVCRGGGRHPWEEEPPWEVLLPELELGAIELLVELESGAGAMWRQALATLQGELELDPGLSTAYARCLELGPWAWLRSTPLYRSLEHQISDPWVEDWEWASVPEAR